MSLPDLIKHVYHNATDEVIRRGKRIFHTSGVQMIENDSLIEQVVFRVRNDVYSNYYKVTVQNYLQPKNISLRCQCPYNMGSVCRHEAAALFQLNDLLQSGYFEHVKIQYDQQHTTIRMRQITTHFLKLFSSAALFENAELLVSGKKVKILEAKDDAVKAEVTGEDGIVYPVLLKQNEERYFDTSCTCDEGEHPLCLHKAAAFLDILNKHGGHYFSTLRNWDTQKDKLLSLYGYSLKDDLTGKFDFSYHDGKPFLRVLDSSIKKISMQPAAPVSKYKEEKEAVVIEAAPLQKRRLGVLIGGNKSEYFPYTGFELLSGEPDENNEGFTGTVEKLEASQYISPAGLQERDKLLVTALRKQSADELFKSIKRDTPFGEFWDSLPKELHDFPKDELRKQVWDFYLPRYQRLLEHFSSYPFVYYLPEGKYFVTANLEKGHFSQQVFQTQIFVAPQGDNGDVLLELRFQVEEDLYHYTDVNVINSALISAQNTFHAAANIDVVAILEQFRDGGLVTIVAEDWPEYLEKDLLPLSGNTSIVFAESLKDNITEVEPELKLYLRDRKSVV